ncbi:unnamed protein product [Diamesa serratosioi]
MTSAYNNNIGHGVRLTASDPHFVCLGGGGRLSTGVSLHNIPIGNLTIGSALSCDIILKGPSVFEHHCSISRSEDDVIIVPCPNARILIDGVKITNDFYLQQGSMLTIGDSNLRFNHPLKAEQLKKTAMNSSNQTNEENEEIFCKNYKTNFNNFTENNVPKNLNNSVDNISRKMQNLKLKTNEFYPRMGSLPLKIYPILGTADQNPPKLLTPADEMKELDEVLQMFTEYNNINNNNNNNNPSKNASISSIGSGSTDRIKTSPLLQNRIKTNGSLPKNFHTNDGNFFFNNFQDLSETNNKQNESYGSIDALDKPKRSFHSPQSPRTKIKTYINTQPKVNTPTTHQDNNDIKNRIHNNNKSEYDTLIKTFEDKFRMDIFDIQNCENNSLNEVQRNIGSPMHLNQNKLRLPTDETEYNAYINGIKIDKNDILINVRSLKMEISQLQRQESEIYHELDMEKSLVSAEMRTEEDKLSELLEKLNELRAQMKKMEMQRSENQAQQEEQQILIKSSIERKQSEVDKLTSKMKNYKSNKAVLKELEIQLERAIELLENDKKIFEDMEFQYLEEETEWFSFREEFKENIKSFTYLIEEKETSVRGLAQIKLENEKVSLKEQKVLEIKMLQLKQNLEVEREKLKDIETKTSICDKNDVSCSDCEDETVNEEYQSPKKAFDFQNQLCDTNDLLFKPPESCKKQDIMSKSFNENMFFYSRNIETPAFDSFLKTNSSECNKSKFMKSFNMTFSFDEDLLKTIGSQDDICLVKQNRTPSQDDIDRISEVTTRAPILTNEEENFKTKKSIETIEKNRQLFLTTRATSVIDTERQRMELLKKQSSDAAKAEYLQLTLNRHNTFTDNNLEINKKKNVCDCTGNRSSNPEYMDQTDTTANHMVDSLNIQSQQSKAMELTNTSSTSISSSETNINDTDMNTRTEKQKVVVKRTTPKHQRPLTRYLPILSQELNLRQHIETAGHQLQLCPYIFINDTSCRGYLNKMGAKFGGWSKRWFVFDRERSVMLYFSDKSEKKPRGGAYFASIMEVYLDHTNTKTGRFCIFVVKTKGRIYHLQAQSAATARIWIDVFITGAQGSFIEY